jgi:adenylate cyclase class 2
VEELSTAGATAPSATLKAVGMLLEVELKFALADPPAVWAVLEPCVVTDEPVVKQSDRYYAHPSRDFQQTDEALRVRSVGDDNVITYKGPELDHRTKTRRELELPLAPGPQAAHEFTELLQALGFVAVRTVEKQRRAGTLTFDGQTVNWAWDVVPPLGTFLELERVVAEAGCAEAQELLCRLARSLGLAGPERRSYLEMLLESDQNPVAVTA